MSIQQSGYYPVFSTPNEAAVQASGSTTARTLSNRFGEVFHVEDYGAVGDGVADDAAEIQAAINAAIAAGGGTIEFGKNKIYYLNTRKLNSFGRTSLGNHLEIANGSLTTKLFFNGNGSTLYSTTYNANGCAILYICSRWNTIKIENLTFEKNVPPFTNSGEPNEGIRIVPFDYNTHELFSFKNCKFIDCSASFIAESGALSKTRGKFKNLQVSECTFLHYKGSNRPSLDGGGVTWYCTQWIENAVFDRIYWDGMTGDAIPVGVGFGKDGFIYPAARYTTVTNSYIKNSCFEGLKFGDPTESAGLVIRCGSFVQPEIGDNVTVTVSSNSTPNGDFDVLEVGGVYAVHDPSVRWEIGACGVYEVISTTNPNYSAGPTATQIVLKRINSDAWRYGPEASVGSTIPANNFFISQKFLDLSAYISNNTFLSIPLRQVGSTPPFADLGATKVLKQVILACSGSIIGNKFLGSYGTAIDTGSYAYTATEPRTIVGNVFVLQHDLPTQPSSAPKAIESGRGNTIIANNAFYAKESKDVVYFIFQQDADKISINNNSFVIEKPYSVAQKTRIVNFNALGKSVTGNASTNTLTVANHDYRNNQPVKFTQLNGGTSPVGGLSVGTAYYVRDVSGNTFKISSTSGGDVFDFTTNITSNSGITKLNPISIEMNGNYVNGIDNYANCDPSLVHTLGPYYGTLRSTVATDGSNNIKIAEEKKSQDGSKWMMAITNDGEIEIYK